MNNSDKYGRRAQLLRTNYREVIEDYTNKLGLQEKKQGRKYSDEQLNRIVDEDLVSWSRIAFTNMVNDDGIENAMKKALSRSDVNNLGGWINSFLKKLNSTSTGAARYLHTQETQTSYEAQLMGNAVEAVVVAAEDEFPDFETVELPVVVKTTAKASKKSKSGKVRLETLVTPQVKAEIERLAELAGEPVSKYAGVVLAQSI